MEPESDDILSTSKGRVVTLAGPFRLRFRLYFVDKDTVLGIKCLTNGDVNFLIDELKDPPFDGKEDDRPEIMISLDALETVISWLNRDAAIASSGLTRPLMPLLFSLSDACHGATPAMFERFKKGHNDLPSAPTPLPLGNEVQVATEVNLQSFYQQLVYRLATVTNRGTQIHSNLFSSTEALSAVNVFFHSLSSVPISGLIRSNEILTLSKPLRNLQSELEKLCGGDRPAFFRSLDWSDTRTHASGSRSPKYLRSNLIDGVLVNAFDVARKCFKKNEAIKWFDEEFLKAGFHDTGKRISTLSCKASARDTRDLAGRTEEPASDGGKEAKRNKNDIPLYTKRTRDVLSAESKTDFKYFADRKVAPSVFFAIRRDSEFARSSPDWLLLQTKMPLEELHAEKVESCLFQARVLIQTAVYFRG